MLPKSQNYWSCHKKSFFEDSQSTVKKGPIMFIVVYVTVELLSLSWTSLSCENKIVKLINNVDLIISAEVFFTVWSYAVEKVYTIKIWGFRYI